MRTEWTTITQTSDITPQLIKTAEDVYDNWEHPRIDWELFFDYLEGAELENGTLVDFGPNLRSAAVKEIIRHLKARAKENKNR